MKKILLFALCNIMLLSGRAQDIIIFTSGEEVKAKVVEVSDTEIKYKTWSNQTGPTWVKKTTDIFMIRYENGTKQMFTTAQSQPQSQSTPQQREATPQPQQSSHMTQSQDVKSEIPIAAHFLIGADVRFGYNMTPVILSLIGSSVKEDDLMSRWPFSFDAFVDFFPQKTIQLSQSDESFTITGFGFGAAYVNRGGSLEFTSTNSQTGTTYLEKGEIDLAYIALRPALVLHTVNRNNTEQLTCIGFELGIPYKATATFEDRGIKGVDITDEADFLTDYSYGVFMEFRSLSKVNVGVYMEFAWNLFDGFFDPAINAKAIICQLV